MKGWKDWQADHVGISYIKKERPEDAVDQGLRDWLTRCNFLRTGRVSVIRKERMFVCCCMSLSSE
jgi:hypothetical protein